MKLSPAMGENDKRRVSTLYFLLLVLVITFAIITIICIVEKFTHTTYAVLAADAIILLSIILVNLGHRNLPSYLIPFGLLAVNVYILIYGQGTKDISIFGLPIIIALGGLVLDKRSALVLAGLCILSFSGVFWAETLGLTPNVENLLAPITLVDLIAGDMMLIATGLFIYYVMKSLSDSLEETSQHELALRKVNDELQHYTAILEQRSRQLLTGAKVSRVASSILAPDELCQQVVDMVSDRFELYFVSLFLVDETGKWAVLHAGTGEAGRIMLKRGHRLRIENTSMIGWCTANQKARIALDVGNEAVRFNNPLLPDTRSELALPLISRGQMIGALGIQSDKEAAFSEEDIAIFQAMADQVANAISNARLYNQLEIELTERKRVEREIRLLNTELEQRVAERTSELVKANEELRNLSRLKDEFLANVSHELRTPLTSIKLFHDLLEKQPQNLGQYTQHLKRETDRLARLIEDILYLSRLEQGYAPINPAPLDLNRLAQEYVADRSLLAADRHLTLTLAMQASIPAALADEQMIGMVLSALLTNALNYTPAGGLINVSTYIKENEGRMWAGFAVSDTGPGISPEDQQRLFERFFRGKAGRASAAPGTGLGLSIAREIITRHGGRIEVQSTGKPGEGTTFSVWLPVAA
ncbi:MAG TPA: ATP-binding protein [Anaerolineales bacterium]|nr:ATP-binding protein [Anaerolineales bacterium]